MLILLRLAEDVITFQTLPSQRRRDIQQTLTQNMESIFTFMMAILQLNVEDYRKLVCVVLTLNIHHTSYTKHIFVNKSLSSLYSSYSNLTCVWFLCVLSRKHHQDVN